MCVVVWYPQCKYINNFRFFKNFLEMLLRNISVISRKTIEKLLSE